METKMQNENNNFSKRDQEDEVDLENQELKTNEYSMPPPPPAPISPSLLQCDFVWVDITEEFFDAVSYLKVGELFHDDLFGLFEAMSAIEMMDPKMDAGMLCNRFPIAASPSSSRLIMNFDQALAEGRIKLEGLSFKDQIGIMDRTLCCLVSWLEGHSLAQTVFTNLYLHKPYAIQDSPLKAFSIATYKFIDLVRDFVNRVLVFEEEDFQSALYGYRLQPDQTEQRTLAILRETEAELKEIVYLSSSASKNNSSAVSSQQVEWALALNNRIRFFRQLYQLLLALKKDSVQMGGGMGECYNLIAGCTELLANIRKTVIPYHPSCDATPQEIQKYWWQLGFEPMINQRLLPPTFPRFPKIKTIDESLRYFEQFLQRLKLICKVTNYCFFHDALNYFIEVSRLEPCILSRSIMQVLYMPPENGKVLGTYSFIDTLRDAARSYVCPPSLTLFQIPAVFNMSLKDKEEVRESTETFFSHCMRPFHLFIQLSGHNRARQRDKLALMIKEFALLQEEAEQVDAYLHCIFMSLEPARSHLACYATWILYHVLKLMIMYLLSGFELELYSTHEFIYIYWYLHEFLYGWLVSALTRAENIALTHELENDNALAAVAAASAGSSATASLPASAARNKSCCARVGCGCARSTGGMRSSRKKKPCACSSSYCNPPTPPTSTTYCNGNEIAMSQALQHFCGAYYKALIGLQMEGKVRTPYFEFDQERVRYEHRFAPFAGIVTPPLVTYAEFREAVAVSKRSRDDSHLDNVYSSASRNFHQARSAFETLQARIQLGAAAASESTPNTFLNLELAQLIKIAKTNYVVMNVLASGHKRGPEHILHFDFSASRYFPIFKLTSSPKS